MVQGLRISLTRAAASYPRAVRHLFLFPFDEPSTFFLYPLMQVLSLSICSIPRVPSLALGSLRLLPSCPALEQPPRWLRTGIPSSAGSPRKGGLGVQPCPQQAAEPGPSQSSSSLHCVSLWLLLCSTTHPWHTQIPSPLGQLMEKFGWVDMPEFITAALPRCEICAELVREGTETPLNTSVPWGGEVS